MADWDQRYLDLAKLVAGWSKDPSSQIGAVAVGKHGQILSTGYNGFPRGVADDHRLDDKETKYSLTVHAELNCLLNAALSGISLENSKLYVFGLPMCSDCAKSIAQSGVSEVIMPKNAINTDKSKWVESWKLSSSILNECGVKYRFV